MFRSTEITRKKCGEIYVLSDDNFALICEICEDELYTLEEFRGHVKEHMPKSSVHIKIEDSISCDSDDCELIIPEKIANVKDNFIDILQDYVGTQESASKRTDRSHSSKSDECHPNERNEVNPLKRFHGLQPNSGYESDSTTESTINLTHPDRHQKRHRKVIGKSSALPIIAYEEFQTDDNGTDYSSDLNTIDLNTIELRQNSGSEIPEYEQFKRKKGTFLCRYCRKIFRSNRGRNDHENSHTGKKPHQCSICKLSFARYANFWSHSKTHTD